MKRFLVESERKKRKVIIIILSIFLALVLIGCGTMLFVNNYLNKVNYSSEVLEINPDDIDDFNSPELDDADKNIADNISDNKIWYHDDILNILLIGYDYGDANHKYYPRSDSMIIASINKITKKIKFVSISRATYVSIPGHKNGRLNAAHAYGGPSLLIKTIEKNFKIRIDKYVSVNFDGFIDIIDTLGGVDVNLTNEEVNYLKEILKDNGVSNKGAGSYHLNGNLALAYSRIRSIDSDRARTQRQRNVLTDIAKKSRSMGLSKTLDVLDNILPLITTDFTKMGLVSQATNGLNYTSYKIENTVIPRKTSDLQLIDGFEVLLVDWSGVRNDVHDLLYPNIEPKTVD